MPLFPSPKRLDNAKSERTHIAENPYLPKLEKDDEFVKNCFRNRGFWAKLNDEEKAFCMRSKNKMKTERPNLTK